jgi:DNA-binding MarR family transcriptional regulator
MSHATAGSASPLRFRILNWIGIINQLAGTRANRRLQRLALPFPQFVLLTHFSAHPERQQTLTALARAMQQPQPATTKTVQKLVAAGLLREVANPEDGRSKLLGITAAGLVRQRAAVAALRPDLDAAFAGWSAPELERLFTDLDRLKIRLDENR